MQIYSLLQFQVKHLNLEGCGPEGNTLQFFSSDKLCTALCLAWLFVSLHPGACVPQSIKTKTLDSTSAFLD